MIASPASVLAPCPGCGVLLPQAEGAVHRYMIASPACWATYGEVLAREYQDPAGFGRLHRLSVDAYAAQHPGEPCPESIKSVGVHLVRLGLVLERGLSLPRANAAMLRISELKHGFHWLEPPARRGSATVELVHAAKTADQHLAAVRHWAEAVWMAWSDHHAQIAAWMDQIDLNALRPRQAAR